MNMDSINNTALTNSTVKEDHGIEIPSSVAIFNVVLAEVTAIAILIVNIITIVTISKIQQLQTMANKLFMNLSFADTILGLSLLYCSVRLFAPGLKYTNNNEEKSSCLTCQFLLQVSASISFLTFALIAFDRFIVVMYPLKYVQIITDKRLYSGIFIVWMYGIGSNIILVVFNEYPPYSTECTSLNFANRGLYYTLIIGIAVLVTIFSTILYSRLFYVAWKQAKQIKAIEQGVSGQDNTVDDKRLTKTMVIVFGVLYICYAPFLLTSMLRKPPFKLWFEILHTYCKLFVFCNSFLNAILYTWRNKEFRQSIIKVFRQKQ
ncbi:unnamed protein product [Owenia fusiformis]|uniref:Uncharacterized protein n=1 Tax=Owenia fusiformis TaxID=6347 RepID=A0A8J1XLD3_OWEFU|nr:unnamed protein product [Owenia fusiformis]